MKVYLVDIESQLGGSLIGPEIKGKLVFNISQTFFNNKRLKYINIDQYILLIRRITFLLIFLKP